MHWIKMPVTSSKFPAAQHMAELRAAMLERAALCGESVFGGLGIDAISDVSVGAYGRYMQEYQDRLEQLMYRDAGTPHWAATWDEQLKSLVAPGVTAGGGQLNVVTHAFGSGTDWRKKGGLPPGDPGHVKHPNDIYEVLNKLMRLKTINFRDGGNIWLPSGTARYGLGQSNASHAAARAAAYAALAPGAASYPLIGRAAFNMVRSGQYLYRVNVQYCPEATLSFNLPAMVVTRAWLIVEKFAPSQPDVGTWEHFAFLVKVNGTQVGSLSTSNAANITGFLMPQSAEGYNGAVWAFPVDADDLVLGGSNTVVLAWDVDTNGNPGADPGYPLEMDSFYSQCLGFTAGWPEQPCISLVLDVTDHFDFRKGDFKRGDFDPKDFRT